MERINSPDGLFHEGDPASGQKGTKVTADWLNGLQDLALGMGGDIVTAAVETTLTEAHGVLFADPPEGQTVPYHLPNYASAGPFKRYKVKNIGQGEAQLNAADGKTIDGELTISLNPGDRCEITKDGANWQTI
jgi:hypothetical protein